MRCLAGTALAVRRFVVIGYATGRWEFFAESLVAAGWEPRGEADSDWFASYLGGRVPWAGSVPSAALTLNMLLALAKAR